MSGYMASGLVEIRLYELNIFSTGPCCTLCYSGVCGPTMLVFGNQAYSDSWSWRSGVRAKKRCKDPVSEDSLRLGVGQLRDIAFPS